MRKILLTIVALLASVATMNVWAVPAYPGWQTKTLSDGTTVEVRQTGDEFYSFWETRDGQIAREQADGSFVKTAETRPTPDVFKARRTRARNLRMEAPIAAPRRGKQAIGTTPNLAPRGVVLLVNFTDSEMKAAHTNTLFDNMCNAAEGQCTANEYNNKNYPSAAQYFADQSNGSYRPVFDVFGPVNLPENVKYYGEEGYKEETRRDEHDLYLADFVIDAVLAADAAGCDFSKYDSDNDGWVDFVYIIYAGKGQAYGGTSETIWPHNWELISSMYLKFTHGRDDYYVNSNSDFNLLVVDGKAINKYACSAELDGYNNLGGIGTLCHEFGHVMGLPDFYDIDYGTIDKQGLTPGKWDIMDGGSYNGNMHCPPCYDPWEKYFFGWVDPVNYGDKGADVTLHPNGTENYNVCQVTEDGVKKTAITEGLSYYLEYRQQTGWDEFLPGKGLVAWKVNFNKNAWEANGPNASSTPGAPLFTVATVEGSSWADISERPVTEIQEADNVVTFEYMGGAAASCFAPTNLAAQASNTTAKLTWSGNAQAYELRYTDDTLDNWNSVTNITNTKYTLTELTPGTTYTAQVRSLCETVQSPWSTAVTFLCEGEDPVPCDEPADLQAEVTDTTATIRWTANTAVFELRYQAGIVDEAADGWTEITSITATEYTLSGLNDSTTYTAQVRSLCENTTSDWVSVTFTTFTTPILPDPEPDWTNWSFYDDGNRIGSMGNSGYTFFWAVMFPAETLDSDTLTQIAVYEKADSNTQPIKIGIFAGNTPAASNRLHVETVNPGGFDGWDIIELSKPVIFDQKKNLWIVLNEGSDLSPAQLTADSGDENGRWISVDGTDWFNMSEVGNPYTFMIRIDVPTAEPEEQGLEDTNANANAKAVKLLRNGQLLILRDGKTYTTLGILE